MAAPTGDGVVTAADREATRPVGERLRELRVGRRLTLKEIANRAGLSESFVSQLDWGTQLIPASLRRSSSRLFEAAWL